MGEIKAMPQNPFSNLMGEDQPKTLEEEVCSMCPSLTYQQRVIGFCICFGFGYLLSFMGTLTLIGGINDKNIRNFAVLYILGNIIALTATGFLVGPRQQCKKMFAKTRR